MPCPHVLNKIDAVHRINCGAHAQTQARMRMCVHEELGKIDVIPIEARATFNFACAKRRCAWAETT